MRFVQLTTAGSHVEAELLRGLLVAQEIPCIINAEGQRTSMGTEAGYSDILVLVPEEQLERARALLDASLVPDEPEAAASLESGAGCATHEQPAIAVCSRCGGFICAGCGPVGDPPVCPDCVDRSDDGTARRRRRMLLAAWVMLMVFVGIPVLVNGLALVIASFRGW
jgi:hypothetical protein